MAKKIKQRKKPINLSHLTPQEIIKTMLETPPIPKKSLERKSKKK